MNTQKTLLVIGTVWPEPNSSAAGYRMLQIIECFIENDYKVIFSSSASESEYMSDISQLNIEKKQIELNSSSFDDYVSALQPTVVLFDRFMSEEQFGWRVAENCPKALRILDTEDLHCLRLARQIALKENREFQISDLLVEDVAKREIASILRSDLSIMISKFEMEILIAIFKIDRKLLFYMPFLFDSMNEDNLKMLPSFQERKDFVFIGNFLHEPNWNTVQYLKESIWPLILKKSPQSKLNIYGAYPSQKVLQLNNPKEGFCVHGRANSSKEVIENARILLAPIRFGAGLKGKLAEAMLFGTPSITTTIGAEGMCEDSDWNGSIEDNPEEFASIATELYNDKTKWDIAQKNGIQILNQCFEKNKFTNYFINRITNLLENIEEHRINNFFGAMLQHHSLLSTKYMSRWIEEKNKK